MCPEDIIRSPNLCTGLAFNNFDRFVDTHSGKYTPHDTVSIIFQNIDESASDERNFANNNQDENTGSRKRRRAFDAVTFKLTPYTQKNFFIERLLPIYDAKRLLDMFAYKIQQQINAMWMLSHAFNIPNTAM